MGKEKEQGSELTLMAIAIPVFIEFFLTFSVFLTDTFFLSYVSDLAAASVGSIVPLFMIFVILYMMMAQGGGNVASQYLGAKKPDSAENAYLGLFVINLVIGIAGVGIFYFGAPYIGLLLGMPEEGGSYVSLYLMTVSPVMLLISIKTAYAAILASQGKTIWSMISAVLINVTNISLNYVFVTGAFGLPQLGLLGIVYATIISQCAAAVFLFVVVHRKYRINVPFRGGLAKFRAVYKQILAIGIPSSFEPISVEISLVVIASMAIHLGVEEMAARTYTVNLMILGVTWAAALAIANQILVAHKVGAKAYEDANKQLHATLIIAVSGSFVIAVLAYWLSEYLVGMFTESPEIIQLSTTLLAFGILLEPFRAFGMASGYSLKASGDGKYPAVLGMLSTWFVGMPLAYFVGVYSGYGLAGVWFGLVVDEMIRAGINYLRWTRRRWTTTGVSSDEESVAEVA